MNNKHSMLCFMDNSLSNYNDEEIIKYILAKKLNAILKKYLPNLKCLDTAIKVVDILVYRPFGPLTR